MPHEQQSHSTSHSVVDPSDVSGPERTSAIEDTTQANSTDSSPLVHRLIASLKSCLVLTDLTRPVYRAHGPEHRARSWQVRPAVLHPMVVPDTPDDITTEEDEILGNLGEDLRRDIGTRTGSEAPAEFKLSVGLSQEYPVTMAEYINAPAARLNFASSKEEFESADVESQRRAESVLEYIIDSFLNKHQHGSRIDREQSHILSPSEFGEWFTPCAEADTRLQELTELRELGIKAAKKPTIVHYGGLRTAVLPIHDERYGYVVGDTATPLVGATVVPSGDGKPFTSEMDTTQKCYFTTYRANRSERFRINGQRDKESARSGDWGSGLTLRSPSDDFARYNATTAKRFSDEASALKDSMGEVNQIDEFDVTSVSFNELMQVFPAVANEIRGITVEESNDQIRSICSKQWPNCTEHPDSLAEKDLRREIIASGVCTHWPTDVGGTPEEVCKEDMTH